MTRKPGTTIFPKGILDVEHKESLDLLIERGKLSEIVHKIPIMCTEEKVVIISNDKFAELLSSLAAQTYWIWCYERSMYWGVTRGGYTRNRAEAGVYSHAEAIEICTKANQMGIIEEAMIPRTIEDGRNLNG